MIFYHKMEILDSYNKCEVIEIFGYQLDDQKAFNIFTLIVFEETQQQESEKYLSNKLIPFQKNKNIKWGIKRTIINIDKVKFIFENLKNKKILKIQDNADELKIGKIVIQNKQYILTEPQINSILKNNFHSGSYIIEGFDLTKKNCSFLLGQPEVLNNFSEQVSEIIPIRLLSDRLGNIIFQFPINLFKVAFSALEQYKGFQLDFVFHQKLKKELDFQVIAENRIDNLIADYLIQDIKNNEPIFINTSDKVSYKIYDKRNKLIIGKGESSPLKTIAITSSMGSHQDRFFYINGRQERIQVSHPEPTYYAIGNRDKKSNDWLKNRKYEYQLKELDKTKAFIQYKEGENAKALKDIRYLINLHGRDGVYLWDPFLSAIDIKNTLYYSQFIVKLKALTAIEEKNIEEQRKKFEKDDKNFLQIYLEVRKSFRKNFHDRFLIFPVKNQKFGTWNIGKWCQNTPYYTRSSKRTTYFG